MAKKKSKRPAGKVGRPRKYPLVKPQSQPLESPETHGLDPKIFGQEKPVPEQPKKIKDPNVGYKRPPVATRFKPGQSGNPLGGKLHDPIKKQFAHLTKKELIEVGNVIIKGTLSDLDRIRYNPNATNLQLMIVEICNRIMKEGDMGAFNMLLDRMVGKVKDDVHLTGSLPRIVVNLPLNGRESPRPEPLRVLPALPSA